MKILRTLTKCWIYDNEYIDNDVKVRHHCHITGKQRGSAQGDCNMNLKLNHKASIIFHNLKNYDSHLIITNGLEKNMSFTINIQLSFIDSFQFLSSYLKF